MARHWLRIGLAIMLAFAGMSLQAADSVPADTPALSGLSLTNAGIWVDGVGEGFRRGAISVTVSPGALIGFAAFGSKEAHNMALLSVSAGKMISETRGLDKWYQGNWEGRLELFSGAQYSPSTEWVVGVTPHLRYHFATRTRWVPYLDGGLGVSATSIGPPDLSGYFEFNIQGGLGMNWFVRDDLALSLDARYLHMSCAHINEPNLGANGVLTYLGLTWWF